MTSLTESTENDLTAAGPVSAGERLERLISPVVADLGLTLYDVELTSRRGRAVLEVTIENAGARARGEGVTITELVEVNRELSTVLDVEDPIAARYDLEVQSPGVERALVRQRHYELSLGESVHVVFNTIIEGNSVVDGRLVAAGTSGIEVIRTHDNATVKAPYTAIKSARTTYDWAAAKGGKRAGRSKKRKNKKKQG